MLPDAVREPQHLGHFRVFVAEQCAKLAEQIVAQYASVLGDLHLESATAGSAQVKLSNSPSTVSLPSGTDTASVEPASLHAEPGTQSEDAPRHTFTMRLLTSHSLGRRRAVGELPPPVAPVRGDQVGLDQSCDDNLKGRTTTSLSSKMRRFARSWSEARRIVMFMDMSPECDDECAFLFLLADLNHKEIRANIDLIMADSDIRYRWMEHLFGEKFKAKNDWKLREEGDGFQVGTVVVNFYVLHSPQREQVAIKDFAAKVPDLVTVGPRRIHAQSHDLVPKGAVNVVLVAAPIPDLDPEFFYRFCDVQAICVVGTPGGINCQQPSWSGLLSSLHKLGPLIYLAPQFTRMVCFPRTYVQDNPHWTKYMKKTVFDMALTCMARRPEIPVEYGDWGLILRLNAANAKLCTAWFENVMCKAIGDPDSCPAYIRSIVQSYVDRNSGDDRKVGGVVNELQLLGISIDAEVDGKGQPLTPQARELIHEAYRAELFKNVYACVTTTETILFQNEANFQPNTGAGHFRTLYPRCGYSDPQRNLSTIYGVEDAIEILRDLPVDSLTPAYDMVGAIFAMQFLEKGNTESGCAHGVAVDVDHDPLLILDKFWEDWRDSMRKVAGSCHDLNTLHEESLPRGLKFPSQDHAEESRSVSVRGTRCQRFVIHPASFWSFPWAALSLLCIMYDFVTVPLQVFDIDPEVTVMWCTVAFWTVDIVRSFFLGYYRNGKIELRLPMTAYKYARSWFILDFTVTSCDWVYLSSQGTGMFNSRIVTYMRMLRSIRSIRLLKLIQLPARAEWLAETLRMPLVACALQLTQMLLLFFAMMHVIACGWYFLASPNNTEQAAKTWLLDANMQDAGGGMLYATSMHWALAHLLLGEVDVYATNVSERLYSCLIFLIGLVVFSSFVSSLTEFMSEVAAQSAEKKKQDEAVQHYFDKNTVSVHLANQIQIFRRHTRQMSLKSTPRQEIEGLRHLPESLSKKLNAEVYCPRLKEHSFFLAYFRKNEPHLNHAVNTIISEDAYLAKDDVFLPGQDAANVFIIMEGELEYTCASTSYQYPVRAGSWVSEPALWLIWKRHGSLQSTSGSCLMNLNIKAFRSWVTEDVQGGLFASKFAELHARALLRLDKSVAELSDLHMDKETLRDVAKKAIQMTGYTGKSSQTSQTSQSSVTMSG